MVTSCVYELEANQKHDKANRKHDKAHQSAPFLSSKTCFEFVVAKD